MTAYTEPTPFFKRDTPSFVSADLNNFYHPRVGAL